MSALDKAIEKTRGRGLRVVFPETDTRVREAAEALRAQDLCVPVALGDDTEAYTEALVNARGIKEGVARRMVSRPMFRAAAMVAAGDADAMVAGAETPTKKVIEAAAIAIGLREGIRLPSSFFLMRFPDGREMVWADCGLNVAPDASDLAAIAQTSAESARALLGEARVAFLSFSTGTSGAGDSVERVREAAEISGFVGPLQGDAALDPDVAKRKGLGNGDANVLVFPSLDAGNIAYKLAQELAGAQALGPVLQGFSKPVCDLSRGASVDDIVKATVVALALD